mgnify:CR=1 FL=1
MKTASTQQEILLITGTSFSSREFRDMHGNQNGSQLSEREKLAIACWNGLLPEILPEIFDQPFEGKKMYLWEIREAASFLELALGETPSKPDTEFSIDPYLFLPDKFLS